MPLSHLLLAPLGELWPLLISPSFPALLFRGDFLEAWKLKGLWHIEGYESGSKRLPEDQGTQAQGDHFPSFPAQPLAHPGDLSFNPIPSEEGHREKAGPDSEGIGEVPRPI